MGNFFWIFCLLDSLNPPPYGHPLKGGRLPDASFCAALRVPPFKGGRGDSKTRFAQFQITPCSTYPESTYTVP